MEGEREPREGREVETAIFLNKCVHVCAITYHLVRGESVVRPHMRLAQHLQLRVRGDCVLSLMPEMMYYLNFYVTL